MGRLPLGIISPYVKTSSGGSMDPMKFYCTSYGAAYGQEGFHPRNGFHFGAGYKTNYRPVVQYSPNLDKLDNPAVGKLLQDNYESTTTKHFQPLQLPDGSILFPGVYISQAVVTDPVQSTVMQGEDCGSKIAKFIRLDSADLTWTLDATMSSVMQQNVLGLSSLAFFSAPSLDQGPRFMSTEYGSKFRFNIPGQPDFLQKKTIGAKEESGFTEGCLANPIVDKPTSQDSSPGVSIMKTDYRPSSVPHGDEFLPVLSKGSERGSGFSRQKDLRLGTSFSQGLPPNAEASGPLSHSQYQGHQRQPQTQTNLLGREYVGNTEPTGFSINNLNYVTPAHDPNLPNKFLTSYNSKFYENIPKGVDREGWTRGGIQPQQAGGFATNYHGTDLGTDPNATETLRTVHPHVGRTITTVDPFYRDSPHDRRFAALHQTTVPN